MHVKCAIGHAKYNLTNIQRIILTTEMHYNGSKPCQGHIKRQHSETKILEICYNQQQSSLAHCTD